MALTTNICYWEDIVHEKLLEYEKNNNDGSHDIYHFDRVSRKAILIFANTFPDTSNIEANQTTATIIVCAGLLHDVVNIPKDSPNRSNASKMSAETAEIILNSVSFPKELINRVKHAIEAHSYSAGIKPTTIEAKCVQDADRLESLGALGIIRCFYVGYMCNREPYCTYDILAENREQDDSKYTLDHFNIKISKLPDLMNTPFAKKRSIILFDFIVDFIQRVSREEPSVIEIINDIIDCAKRKAKLVVDSDSLFETMKRKEGTINNEYYSIFLRQFEEELTLY